MSTTGLSTRDIALNGGGGDKLSVYEYFPIYCGRQLVLRFHSANETSNLLHQYLVSYTAGLIDYEYAVYHTSAAVYLYLAIGLPDPNYNSDEYGWSGISETLLSLHIYADMDSLAPSKRTVVEIPIVMSENAIDAEDTRYPYPWIWRGMNFRGVPTYSWDENGNLVEDMQPWTIKYTPLEMTTIETGRRDTNATKKKTDIPQNFLAIADPAIIVGGSVVMERCGEKDFLEFVQLGGTLGNAIWTFRDAGAREMTVTFEEDIDTGVLPIYVLSSVAPTMEYGSVSAVTMIYGNIQSDNSCVFKGNYTLYRLVADNGGDHTVKLSGETLLDNVLTRARLRNAGAVMFDSVGEDWWDLEDVDLQLAIESGDSYFFDIFFREADIPADWEEDTTEVVRLFDSTNTQVDSLTRDYFFHYAALGYVDLSFDSSGIGTTGKITINAPAAIPFRLSLTRRGEQNSFSSPIRPVILMGNYPQDVGVTLPHFISRDVVEVRDQTTEPVVEELPGGLYGELDETQEAFKPIIEGGAVTEICPDLTLYFTSRCGQLWTIPLFIEKVNGNFEKAARISAPFRELIRTTPVYSPKTQMQCATLRFNAEHVRRVAEVLGESPTFAMWMPEKYTNVGAEELVYCEVYSIDAEYSRDATSGIIRITLQPKEQYERNLKNIL